MFVLDISPQWRLVHRSHITHPNRSTLIRGEHRNNAFTFPGRHLPLILRLRTNKSRRKTRQKSDIQRKCQNSQNLRIQHDANLFQSQEAFQKHCPKFPPRFACAQAALQKQTCGKYTHARLSLLAPRTNAWSCHWACRKANYFPVAAAQIEHQLETCNAT